MEPQLFSCGLWRDFDEPHIPRMASMEPQLFSCGLHCMGKRNLKDVKGFNGAATFQLRIGVVPYINYTEYNKLQWSRNFSVADCCGVAHKKSNLCTSFNGAATFQLRIVLMVIDDAHEFATLQWSRNFSVADCTKKKTSVRRAPVLQWSRNFSVADCIVLGLCLFLVARFNGAATFQLRIVLHRRVGTQ